MVIGNLDGNHEGVYRIGKNREIVIGQAVMAYRYSFDYHLISIKVYADGLIDCLGLVDVTTFKERVRSGLITTQLSDNTDLSVFLLNTHRLIAFSDNLVQPEDLILQVEDILDNLNNRPDSLKRCRDRFREYQRNPSLDAQEELREVYFAVPAPMRRFILGDIEAEDDPIIKALGLELEHRDFGTVH